MEAILIMLITGALVIFSYTLGLKNGQKANNNIPIEIPKLNPITIIEEHKENKEIEKKLKEIEIVLDNINNYDGTSLGQKEV